MVDSNQIKALLKGVRPSGQYSFNAYCPCHNNRRTQALSVTITREGRLLVYCHAGCDSRDILQYLRSNGVDTSGYKPNASIQQQEDLEATRKKFMQGIFGKGQSLFKVVSWRCI